MQPSPTVRLRIGIRTLSVVSDVLLLASRAPLAGASYRSPSLSLSNGASPNAGFAPCVSERLRPVRASGTDRACHQALVSVLGWQLSRKVDDDSDRLANLSQVLGPDIAASRDDPLR